MGQTDTTTTTTAADGGTGSGATSAGAGTNAATQTTTTPPPNANTTPGSTADWITGIKNEELRGFVQNKGFKDPEVMADSYRNLEKLRGVPENQLLKLPEKFDSPEGEQVWQRLGKPEKPEGYGLDAGKDATESSKEFIEWAKIAFHKSNLTSEQAKGLIEKFNEFQTATMTKQEAAALTEGKNNVESLQKEWGNAHDTKLSIAKKAATEFGVQADQIDAIQKTLGYKKTMELFHSIGSKIGESQFVQGNPRSGNGPTDVATAKANIASKKADASFMAKYASGDAMAKAEMSALFRDAYPGEFSVG